VARVFSELSFYGFSQTWSRHRVMSLMSLTLTQSKPAFHRWGQTSSCTPLP
jgi:hypothetical protein